MKNNRPELTGGHWWEPSRQEKALAGVLFKDVERGWLLELDGSFEGFDPFQNIESGRTVSVPLSVPDIFPLLLGTTSKGRFVSLFDCQVVRGSPRLPHSGGTLALCPSLIAYDVHFESIDDFKLRSLSVRYSHLDSWVSTSGFSVDFSSKFYPVSITYAMPDPVEVAVDSTVSIGIGFSASGPTMPVLTQLDVVQKSWIIVNAAEPRSFEELWPLVVDLGNLVSVNVGQPLQLLEMSASCDVRNGPKEQSISFALIDNRQLSAPRVRRVASHEILFTLPDLRQRFSDVVKRWCSRGEMFRSLYDLYFGTIASPSMYVEHRFLNMFQALESFDRRTYELPSEKKAKHDERLARIMTGVGADDKKWLKGKLRYSHEPAAADRIRRLVKELCAQWLLTDEDIDLAGDLRNYQTHFDAKIEKRLPPATDRVAIMYNLAVRLKTVCEILLLQAAALTPEEVSKRMRECRRVDRQLIRKVGN